MGEDNDEGGDEGDGVSEQGEEEGSDWCGNF
jgi:hypothetical protein